MEEKNIQIKYETIGVSEQRNLIEMTRSLSRAMTKDDYNSIMLIYKNIIDRIAIEAKDQGIEI